MIGIRHRFVAALLLVVGQGSCTSSHPPEPSHQARGFTSLSSEQAVTMVRDAFRRGGVDLDLWDFYAHRCNYPIPQHDDEFGVGWRVIASRIVCPDRVGEAQFLPHFSLDVTIDCHNRIILWFTHDESIPGHLNAKQRLELDQAVHALELDANTKPEQTNTRPNKTDAGNGSYGICRVIDASRSPSPDSSR